MVSLILCLTSQWHGATHFLPKLISRMTSEKQIPIDTHFAGSCYYSAQEAAEVQHEPHLRHQIHALWVGHTSKGSLTLPRPLSGHTPISHSSAWFYLLQTSVCLL